MKYVKYALVALLAVSFGVAATPNDNSVDSVTKWEKAKQAYIHLLEHDNPGVKASAAGYIRKYNIVEATGALKKVLECDNCETVKFSAALALVRIAGENGATIVRNAMEIEQNELVVAFYEVVLHSESTQFIAPLTEN